MNRYAILCFGAAIAGGAALLTRGNYGLTLFLVIPAATGAIGCFIVRPRSAGHATQIGAAAGLIASAAPLLLGIEGIICVTMALPLTLPLGALGGWLAYSFAHPRQARRGIAMCLLLPAASLTHDANAVPPVYEVRSTIEIAAPPEQVWSHVVSFAPMPETPEWFFRAGLAYPMQVRIVGSGIGATRYCDLSTGPVVETIEAWDEPRLLRFRVTESPASMVEWSPYGHITPKHLHGYLISKEGQFVLKPLPNRHTLVEGTSWYQHGLWPAEYWRWWSDAIVHRIHMRVLTHIRALAGSPWSPSQN